MRQYYMEKQDYDSHQKGFGTPGQSHDNGMWHLWWESNALCTLSSVLLTYGNLLGRRQNKCKSPPTKDPRVFRFGLEL